MSQINTQSTLATRLDEKKEREKQLLTQEIDLNGAKIPQNTPLNQSPQNAPLQDDFSQNLNSQGAKDSSNAPFKAFDNDEFNAYKQSLYEQQRQITQSDDLTPEQVEFAVNFSDESDELLKQGVSKKQMIEHLRKGDFLDKASWAMLDKQSGGNDDLIFDFFKQNADSLNPRKEQEKQELKNAQDEKQELENELFALQRAAPILPNDSEGQKRRENELKRIAELEQRLAKYTRPFDDAADSELDLKDDEIKKALFEKKDNYLSHQIQTLGQIPDYLESLILDSASIDNEGQAKVETNIRAIFEQAAQRGEKPKLEDFTGQELARLYRKGYANGDLSDKFGDFATNLTGIKRLEFTRHLIEQGYKAFDKETQISQKDLKDLSKSDKEYLKNRDILSNKLLNKAFYDGDKTTIEEQYYQVKGGAMMELASKEAENVKNFHKQYNLLYNGKEWIAKNFKNGEESKEVFNDYFKKLDNIAEKLSFDGAALNHDTGEFEFYKLNEKTGENDFYKLNERFFDNLPEMFKNNLGAVAGSIIGGAIGTITGARKLDAQKVGKGVKRLGVVGSELAGSAIGGGVGASVDYINNAINKGEKIDFETMMYHAAQDSLFSLAFDTAFIGARKLYSKVKEKGLGNVINAAEKAAKNAFSKVGETAMNFSVIGRFAQNAVDGNAPEIRRAIRESMSDEQREILTKNSKELGIEADLIPNNTSARAFFIKHFGEDSFLTKGYDLFQQAVYLGGQRDLQKELLSTMRSDSEQVLLSYLVETAMQSPKRRANLHKMLNNTSKELINELKSFGLKENEIERVLNRYQKGTEFDFGEAIDNVLKSIYGDDKIYKTTISRENWDKFKTQMLDEHASFGKAIIEPLIEQLEKTLYNPNGVSYKALRDAQEFLNAEFPNLAKQSGKKKYLKAQIQGFIRDDIEKGFNQIFDLNPVVAKDARELFDTAMLDYANMKQIIKEMGENLTQAKTKAGKRKGRQDYENALNKLMDFLTRETPDGQTPFLNKITATMPKEEAERFEIALLDNILKHSRYLIESGDKKVFDIVNSGEFLRRAGEIKGQFGAKAKDYIDLVSAWHKNFKNDAVLAHLTRNPASEPKVSTGLNPSLDARLKYVATATMFDGFFRLVPRIPFITDKFIGNDKIQAAALRYYLKKTLNESPSISALRRKLNFDLDKGNLPLNSQTRARLREITNEVQQSEAQMDELAEKIINDLPTKSTLSEPLSVNEIKQNIEKWDLTNPNPQDKILISKVQGAELEQLKSEFDFKGNYALAREIEAKNVKHALTRHGDEAVENARGQIAITKDDIADYEKYTQKPDLRVVQDNNRILYAKQVNGYYVVIEEVLSGQNKLQFFDMWKGKGKINKEVLLSHSQRPKNASEPNFSRRMPSSDEIIPNSSSQSQAPQKSLLEQARENTERLRAAQEAEQIAQKEAELARLKEMQAKNAEILAQKEAAAGQAINEAQSLEIGTPIKAHKISDTKIIINDNTAPFKAEFIIAKKDDIKPNFERTGTQGRSERQDKVIESIQSDFKPHLIFEQMGGFEGLPIILKDGQVIAGNHRAQAIKGLTGENLARYKQAAKEKFGIDLKDDEVIVRLVKDGDEKELINLAFMSNVGRESNLGEKALANLAKYDSQIQALPNRINAESVFELESQVAKALDTQGNGLNVFDTNLALFSRLAKNSSNTDILESLNTLKNLSQDEKEKALRMFVSNAGEFHNLAKDTQLKSLNLNDYLADALIVAAKNVDSSRRAANYAKLLDDIITMQASAKEMLKIDPFLFENFKSKALGYALARFARLENPSAKLFEFLKASKADLENLYTGNIFESNKAISDIDIYDFLKHAINSGEDLIDKQGRNIKGEITSRLDDLRKVENALIDSGDIQFAKSKAKPQGREAKETNINSLFADDELQMQATKPTRELNLSDEKDFNELSEFFALNSKDKEFNEIFAKATKAAQRLGVKVRFDESAARSHFVLNDNTITIAAANKEHFQAQDLLHELIHATTRKALKDFNENPAKAAKIYTKRQIEAINEIISLYQKSKGIAKRQGKDAYALQNVDEFVAELSSGEFRAFLKAQDIFERFIKALIRFFTGDSERLAKNVNSYKALKESYYKILDDYEPPLVEKSQSQLEFEMAQRQIGELKARKKHYFDIMANAGEKGDDELKAQSKQVIKNIDKEIKNTENKAKLTQKIGKDNLTSDIIKQAEKENKRIIVDKLDSQEAQKLGFDEPEFVAQSVDANEIRHILNEHGVNSNNVIHSKKPAVDENDIANYAKYTDSANEKFYIESNANERAKRVSFKQVNGYYVVVEEVHNGQGELGLKTMFKEKGYYKDGEAYKEISSPQTTSSETTPRVHSISDDKEIIPNSQKQSQASAKIKDLEKELDETYNAYGHAVMARSPSRDELKLKIRKINDELGKLKFSLNENDLGYIDIEPILTKQPLAEVKERIKQRLSEKYQFLDENFIKGDKSFQRQLNEVRKHIETRTNTTPLKEFGTNYAEFYRDGQGAVKKLLAEKQGQVAGAFYRDDLAKATGTGEIDLVWGDSTKGLQHILERRAADFEKQGLTKEQATQKALEFVENDLNEIITKGALELPLDKNGVLVENPQKMFFHLDDKKSVIAVDYQGDRKWVLTAYFKSGDDTPRSAYPHKSEAHGDDFSTSSSAVSSNETLPQNELKSQAGESQVLSAYDKNVLENAPKETIEAHLKSIEKDIDYLEKGLDFYKKNPEQDYNGEMVKFNEKLLTPKLQMQKAYKQRLDELNSLDLSHAPKRNADEIQITLPKEKQTRFTMRQNAYKSLKEVEKTPLTNANDGRVAYLNKTGRQESLSDYAINESAKNGFDEAQHLATAQHLPALFENAKFKETTRDLKNNDKNVKIHRYTANFLLDNEPAQAQITLKETIAGQHSGNKIYTLKLESVSRLSPAEPQNPREALSAINDPKSSGFGEPSTKPSEIVSKIQEKFKFGEKKAKDLFEWHKDSSPLTKNDDGTPKVFYHGSPNEFEVFDIEKTRGELGHYFTDDKSYAEQYMRDNGKLYAVFLKSKNIISLFDPKAAQKYKKFIFGDDLPELEKILKEKYKSSKVSEYDLDNYKSAFYDLMRERNDKNVLRVPSIIGERLKTAGVDGVVSYKGAIVVFDSKQIKSIDNAGSWTDSAGKITKEKPSDESARHSYFNAQSPNILHSNEIWGGGLAGGTLNGLETDEDGNIIGFNPAKFVAGFIAGAAGTKAVKLMLNLKAGQNHALKVATNISEDFKALRENNLPLFAKIMQKIEPQTLLKSSKEAKNLSNEIFNKELQNAIKTAIDKGGIENLSELKKQVHFSKVSEFKAYFDEVKGNQGVIKTPYKDIKVNVFYAFNHFTDNTYKTNRDNIKSAFFSTFKKPLFVVEFTPQGKTKPSTYFYKPFYDENKKLLNLVGISIDEKGLLKFSTFYLDERGNRLKEFLKRTDLTIRYVEPSE